MDRTPEQISREIVDLCSGCELCRDILADTPCLFFPKFFRLYDNERAGKRAIGSDDFRNLMNLCNMCGQCSCAPVRTKIREAKDGFVAREKPKLMERLLKDVRLVGRIGGALPWLFNLLLQKPPTAGLCKKIAGLHPDRKIPVFPTESFESWAKARGLHRKKPATGRKVAYFVGCSGKYLFPQVARATVEVLEHNGVTVYVPEQVCCGAPGMLEGDRDFAFASATANLETLRGCVDDGYDIVCSCPTCGYMLKSVLREGAPFSEKNRTLLQEKLREENGSFARLGMRLEKEESASQRTAVTLQRGYSPLTVKFMVSGLCRDEGYFASLDPGDRLRISGNTYDLGEYLKILYKSGELDLQLGALSQRMVYFPPCHLKEQDMGTPWVDLLTLVPGFSLPTVGGAFDCCGSAGVRGFQKRFHKASLAQGGPLMDKISAADPEMVATDCLSCRLQFNQVLPYPVAHPVEILRDAYRAGSLKRDDVETHVQQVDQ